MPSPVKLPDVTICAADSAFVELTARALRISMAECAFGDAILFSDASAEGPFRCVRIPPLPSTAAYSEFCLRGMVHHIRTPLVLVVQWDGYVVNAQAWANAFRKFDYIGAAWHGVFPPGTPMVGNGGFSLRSLKLLKALEKLPLPPDRRWEDRVICHVLHQRLEREFGVRFAPVKIADRFAYQYRTPQALPFGFHGVENIWRHVAADDLHALVEKLDVSQTNPAGTFRLIQACAENDRAATACSLYLRFRKRYPPAHIERVVGRIDGIESARRQVDLLEALAANQVV